MALTTSNCAPLRRRAGGRGGGGPGGVPPHHHRPSHDARPRRNRCTALPERRRAFVPSHRPDASAFPPPLCADLLGTAAPYETLAKLVPQDAAAAAGSAGVPTPLPAIRRSAYAAQGAVVRSVLGLSTAENSTLVQSARGVGAFDPSLPALMVVIEHLTGLESDFWCKIRGLGLSYGYSISNSEFSRGPAPRVLSRCAAAPLCAAGTDGNGATAVADPDRVMIGRQRRGRGSRQWSEEAEARGGDGQAEQAGQGGSGSRRRKSATSMVSDLGPPSQASSRSGCRFRSRARPTQSRCALSQYHPPSPVAGLGPSSPLPIWPQPSQTFSPESVSNFTQRRPSTRIKLHRLKDSA